MSVIQTFFFKTRYHIPVIFIIALCVYLSNITWLPYPDSSSAFLMSLASYNTLPTPMSFPGLSNIGILLFKYTPEYAVVLLNGFGALLAAFTCVAVYRMSFFLTRFFCMDVSNESFLTDVTVHKENDLIATLVSILSVILFTMSAIMLSVGTRIYPFSMALTFLVWGLSFCMEFRWRIEILQQQPDIKIGLRERFTLFFSILFLSIAALASLDALFVSVPLFFYTIFPIFRQNARFIKSTTPFIGCGFLIGVVIWFLMHLIHFRLLGYNENVTPLILTTFSAHLIQDVSFYTTAHGVIGIIYLFLLITLLVGIFPELYFHFRRPILGQLFIILASISIFISQPTIFWGRVYQQPTLLHVAIVLLMAITLSTLIGAWLKNALDYLYACGRKSFALRFLGISLLLVLIGTMPYSIINISYGARQQLPSSVDRSTFFSDLTPFKASTSPTIWLNPSSAWDSYLLTQFIHGTSFSRVSLSSMPPQQMLLPGGTFNEICEQDPMLAKLAQTSTRATWYYLMTHAPYAESFRIDHTLPIAFSAIPMEMSALNLTFEQQKIPLSEQFQALSSIVNQMTSVYGQVLINCDKNHSLINIVSSAINRLVCQAIKENVITRKLCTLMHFAYKHNSSNYAYLINYHTLLRYTHSEIPSTLAHRVMQFYERYPELINRSGTTLLAFESKYGSLNSRLTKGWEMLSPLRYGESTQIIPAMLKRIQNDPLHLYSDIALTLLKDALSDTQVISTLLPITGKILTKDPQNMHARTLLIDVMCSEPFKDHSDLIQELSLTNEPEGKIVISLLQHLVKVNRNDDSVQSRVHGVYLRTTKPLVAKLYIKLLLLDNKWDRALEFIDQYTTLANLKQSPLLFCKLRIQILNAAETTEEHILAFNTAKRWVINTPYQHDIWTYLFEHYPQGQAAIKLQDIKTCLNLYPAHPAALKALFQE